MATTEIVTSGDVEQRIVLVRGQKVILDADLAALYGVTTSRLNEQVRRNLERFPADFLFELTREEAANLRSQNAISSGAHGGRRYAPYAFTEHGAVMAASVLNTPRAVEVSVFVVRAFVRLREVLATHKDLARKLDEIERKVELLAGVHRKVVEHDTTIREIVAALRQLMAAPAKGKARPLGFRPPEKPAGK